MGNEVRDFEVKVRLDEAEYKAVQNLAHVRGVSREAFIRRAIQQRVHQLGRESCEIRGSIERAAMGPIRAEHHNGDKTNGHAA